MNDMGALRTRCLFASQRQKRTFGQVHLASTD
jgi:hypothetical protein